jgi:hypothetical protein
MFAKDIEIAELKIERADLYAQLSYYTKLRAPPVRHSARRMLEIERESERKARAERMKAEVPELLNGKAS